MGYGPEQIRELEQTINSIDCDAVIIGTPIDLRRVITINKPFVRVRYELAEVTKPVLADIIADFFEQYEVRADRQLEGMTS
jgi:predicted GTPase